jgi:hypothetical protein
VWPLLVLAASCATLGGQSNEGVNLPSSGVGPFRALTAAELALAAIPPNVLSDPSGAYSEPSAVAAGDDPTSAAVWMYAVGQRGGASVIVRTRADDGRTFYGDAADNADTSHPRHIPPVVLQADQAWEGSGVSGPSALRAGGQVWLYYAATGGIGLATSADGLTFAKRMEPVLAIDASAAWETTAPHAPSVAVFPDGTWHMLYGAGNAIGEATSADGLVWARSGTQPVLAASPLVDGGVAPASAPAFDAGGVDDPMLAPRTTVDGRLQVRVLYTGYGDPPGAPRRASAIGSAGRFDTTGPLTRQASPTYTAQLHERGPALFEYAGGSLLYVAEDASSQAATQPLSAIAGAFAPASVTLGPPASFPATP